MADEFFGNRLDASMMPSVFSESLKLYFINNNDLVSLAGSTANEASVAANEANGLANQASQQAGEATQAAASVQEQLNSALDGLDSKYVSKQLSTNQTIQSGGGSLVIGNASGSAFDKLHVVGSANATESYKILGVQVVAARDTGWSNATGTALKGAFNADKSFTIGAEYNQSQIQEVAAALTEARRVIKALKDVLAYHGLTD